MIMLYIALQFELEERLDSISGTKTIFTHHIMHIVHNTKKLFELCLVVSLVSQGGLSEGFFRMCCRPDL